ncbi:MAG: ArsR/SmtB family transcription factor [Candidatus Njordarchaeota archaeon]
MLREGEADLESIQDVLDIDKSKATLWKHLNKLVKAGIVEVRKEGRKNIYKLRARLIY